MLMLLSMLLVILVKLLLWWLQSSCLICIVRDRSVLLNILSLCAVLPPICVRSYCHTSQTPLTIATAPTVRYTNLDYHAIQVLLPSFVPYLLAHTVLCDILRLEAHQPFCVIRGLHRSTAAIRVG